MVVRQKERATTRLLEVCWSAKNIYLAYKCVSLWTEYFRDTNCTKLAFSCSLFPSLGLPSDFMCQSAEVAEEVGERVRRAGAGVDTLVDSLGSKIRGQQEEQEGLDRRLRREVRAMDWKSFQR